MRCRIDSAKDVDFLLKNTDERLVTNYSLDVVYYKDVESRYEVLYKHVLMKFIRTGAALGL